MIDDLYSQQILKLTANIPRIGRLDAPQGSADKIAKLCGSRIHVDLCLDGDRVTDYAHEVKACALGQAAASILASHIIGAKVSEITEAREALHAMLKKGAPPPGGRFIDLAVLAPIKDYPQRHASTCLAFDATVAAIEGAQARL